MGLFKLFSNKRSRSADVNKINKKDAAPAERKVEVKNTVRLSTQAERMNYIKDNCDAFADCGRQIEEAKAEYQAVTSYLTDIQKIDLIPLGQRGALEEAASKIINLSKERGKLRSKSSLLTDKQYRILEQYELQLPKELQSIKENEEYQIVIQQDIDHLEEERRNLDDEQEDIINKQSFLKGIALTISFVVVFLFTLLAVLSNQSGANYTLPFILTVLMGMILAYCIFMEARKNLGAMQIVQMKQNRQITLMNKVKIKSVNNRNFLDYAYNKYTVNNYEQLKALWNEYIKAKAEAERFQNNTEKLNKYNNALISELKRFGITDADIWIYQPTAITDSKEMVEVKHRLNIRRQKLRERIDLNIKQKEDAIKEIKKTMKTYPDCVDDAEKLLRKNRIDLDEQ